MSRVVLVHGIAQQLRGAQTLLAHWYPALRDGIDLAGGPQLSSSEVDMAFYGDVFRPTGHRGLGIPELDAGDVEEGLERELLLQWSEAVAREEGRTDGQQAVARMRTSDTVQRALNVLSRSAFFAGLSERLMIYSARQLRRYFTEPELRARIQDRLSWAVTGRTEVIVAHSLGSVVAYETLCAHPEWPDLTLVTLGSPLGVPRLVFDRLLPQPSAGSGRWPAPVSRWTNIADRGDAVALVKELGPRFGSRVNDLVVHNGAKAHDVRPYLTASVTGQAISAGLNRSSSSG
ncbi:GPI inositol-deacylase [Streptomyces sp. NBC_00638]|uniref:hypothetical protein n=1 Tax=unclassified Streptomyces TaxID=2593676 RepID=UPI00224CB278|nr:hypothetical protein [Streptomyces sp. NBC_00638]MCX5002103.1 GPI inositol-deacylase [Streptomyces sp. NBC_00638]